MASPTMTGDVKRLRDASAQLAEICRYTAEQYCAEGGRPPVEGCTCLPCIAAKLYGEIWTDDCDDLHPHKVAEMLDTFVDARQMYYPEELVHRGIPWELARKAGFTCRGELVATGLSAIESVAEAVGASCPEAKP